MTIPERTETVELKKRHPAAIILNILLDGHPVLINSEEYRYQDGIFGVKREVFRNGVRQEDIVLGVDMNMGSFVKWCEKLPEETIINAIFSHVVMLKRGSRL